MKTWKPDSRNWICLWFTWCVGLFETLKYGFELQFSMRLNLISFFNFERCLGKIYHYYGNLAWKLSFIQNYSIEKPTRVVQTSRSLFFKLFNKVKQIRGVQLLAKQINFWCSSRKYSKILPLFFGITHFFKTLKFIA